MGNIGAYQYTVCTVNDTWLETVPYLPIGYVFISISCPTGLFRRGDSTVTCATYMTYYVGTCSRIFAPVKLLLLAALAFCTLLSSVLRSFIFPHPTHATIRSIRSKQGHIETETLTCDRSSSSLFVRLSDNDLWLQSSSVCLCRISRNWLIQARLHKVLCSRFF